MTEAPTADAPTFAELVAAAAQLGRKPGTPPVSIQALAARCEISRQHFYHLLRGDKTASEWVEERLAKGLGYSLRTVQRALRKTRKQAS